MRLDSYTAILNRSTSGKVVDLDAPDASLLMRAILYQEENFEMPPSGRLENKEIGTIRKWIEQGLSWSEEQEK